MNSLIVLLALTIGQVSLFDDGSNDKGLPLINKAVPLKRSVTIEKYDEPMAMAASVLPIAATPTVATNVIHAGKNFSGTSEVINYQDRQYLVTCNHVVRDLLPKDELIFDGRVCYIVAKDKINDLSLLELDDPTKYGPGTELADATQLNEWLKSQVHVYSTGSDGDKFITTNNHVIHSIDNTDPNGSVVINCVGATTPGRSGAGLYKDNKLLGIYFGNRKDNGLQSYTHVNHLKTLIENVHKYKITFYSGKNCTYCKQQHAITDTNNDRRIEFEWSEDALPDWVRKKLPPGYSFPVAIWNVGDNKVSWPSQPGVYTIDQYINMLEKSKAVPIEQEPLAMGAGFGAVGAIDCKQYTVQLKEWYDKYIPTGVIAEGEWNRSGAQSFNLYGGQKTKLETATIFGKAGSFEFKLKYPEGYTGEKLQVRDLVCSYNVNGDDIDFDIGKITVYGLVSEIDGKLVFSESEQPKSFGLMTLWTIISVARDIWMLMHPVADLNIGGTLSCSTYQDGQYIYIDFVDAPMIKILMLMKFELAVKQIVIDPVRSVVIKFTGSRLIKQYTLDIKQ